LSHGAQVIVPAMDVGDLGVMAVIADPTGASIGMWQPGEHKGFGLVAEPGATAWFELHTNGFDTAVAFYADVFGWDIHPMSEDPTFRYSTLGHDGTEAAGIMDAANFLPQGVPSNWQIYFNVANTDDSVAVIEKLGGSVIQPAEDTPHGRMALVADPTGATFKIVA
jgi:predicted enzyme related to lactoylglutathione lyase